MLISIKGSKFITTLILTLNTRFVPVASSNMLQHTPITAPIHSIKRIGMSKSYGRSILHMLEHAMRTNLQ